MTPQTFDERMDEIVQTMLVDYTSWVNGEPVAWNSKKQEAKSQLRTLFKEMCEEVEIAAYRRGVSDFSNYYMDASLKAQRQQIMPHIAVELLEHYRPFIADQMFRTKLATILEGSK